MTIVWARAALKDLEEIEEYVAGDRPEAARRLAQRLRQRVEHLSEFPEVGRRVPELSPATLREVIVAPYRIIYRAEGERVVVLRVWHSSRLLRRI